MKKIKTLSIFLLMLFSNITLHSKSFNENAGDVLLVLIPSATYGTTFYLDDKEGRMQFYKSLAATSIVSFGLKKAVKKERPDKSDYDSFPSAHSSLTFQSSTFIHKRYGFKYAVIPYLLSSYVAYTRVYADKHYVEDVIVGAAIGMLSSYFFTTKNLSLKD